MCEEIDEETKELMEEYDLDEEAAERARELIEEEGLEEGEAVEIAENV